MCIVTWTFKVERENICDCEYGIDICEVGDMSEESVAHVSIGLAVSVTELLTFLCQRKNYEHLQQKKKLYLPVSV